MPIFEYQAIDLKGKAKRGTVDADTARDAREKLRRQDFRVTEMNQVEATTRLNQRGPRAFLVRRSFPAIR